MKKQLAASEGRRVAERTKGSQGGKIKRQPPDKPGEGSETITPSRVFSTQQCFQEIGVT